MPSKGPDQIRVPLWCWTVFWMSVLRHLESRRRETSSWAFLSLLGLASQSESRWRTESASITGLVDAGVHTGLVRRQHDVTRVPRNARRNGKWTLLPSS